MTPLCALVLPARRASLDQTIVAGLPLVDRVVLDLHRAGLDHIVVSTERLEDRTLAARLARQGVVITIPFGHALDSVPRGGGAVLVSADVVFEPAAIGRMLEAAAGDETRGRFAADALGGLLAYVPPAMLEALRTCRSIRHGLFEFYRSGGLVRVDVAPLLCSPVPPSGDVRTLEHQYKRRVRTKTTILSRVRQMVAGDRPGRPGLSCATEPTTKPPST